MPSGPPCNLELHRSIAALRAKGLSLRQIGQMLGVSRQAVHSVIRTMRRSRTRFAPVPGVGP
jgi:hypothetical protein